MRRRGRRVKRNGELSFRPARVHFNRRKLIREILNYILIIFVAAVFGYAFVTFGYQTVTVVGPSMREALSDGDVVVVNKYAYKLGEVKRYDIIAYSQVGSDSYYEIKRVIGLPGETVLIDDGTVYINGERLKDIPFDDKILSAGVAGSGVTLGDNEYFVLGDNVNNSEDSRYTNVGNISGSEIVGRVCYRISPKNVRGKL